MFLMKTKICPHCGKELPAEAVLCKFCHNLLIDEDGNMTPAQSGSVDDEEKTKRFKVPAEMMEHQAGGASADEVYPENGRHYREREEDYEDDYEDEYDGDEHKRLLIITACITLGILVVVIAAILIGMHLFGSKGSTDKDVSKNSNSSKIFVEADSEENGGEQQGDANGEGNGEGNGDTTDEQQPAVTDQPVDTDQPEVTTAPAETSESSDTQTSVDESSSTAETTDTSSAAETTTTTTASAPEGGDYESTVLAAASSQISGEVTSSQYRTDDGTYVYYYFFTAEHGYSVAYNKLSGECIVVQSY